MRSPTRVLPCAIILLAACSSPPSPDAACAGDACSDITIHDAGSDAPFDGVDPHAMDLVSVQVTPAMATLTSTDGSQPMQTFTVTGTRRDGTATGPLTGVWSTTVRAIGTIDPSSGVFTASGVVGGPTEIDVAVAGPGGATVRGMATLTVSMHRTIAVSGDVATASAHFATPPVTDAARAVNLEYPLDGALMPQNVYPADIQWEGGTAGDVFRVTLQKPDVNVVAYVPHTGSGFQYHWLVDASAWHTLAQSDPDADASIVVDRWDSVANQVVGGTPLHIHFADAAVTGSVYYWNIGAGRAFRIDDGTATRVDIIPNPPTHNGTNCLGCHAVSRDGRYFAGRINGTWGNGAGVTFDLTADLSGSPATTLFPLTSTSLDWIFSSFSPDGRRLVVDRNGPLALIDPTTGAMVSPAMGSAPANGTMPSWSPDGGFIAYIANWAGSDSAHLTSGDVAVVPVPAPDSFGTPVVLHHGSDLAGAMPGGNADSYPTWSPDSHWIAFAHGTESPSSTGEDALYLMSFTGGAPVRLSNACGGANTGNNYLPNFSPFDSGGYFWMSFLSRRDYGNPYVGTRGTMRQQIWVTAVQDHPGAGTDPSAAPYWLPGQDPASMNISAFWSPRPCRADGSACGVGSECCSGVCGGADGGTVCSAPPPSECHSRGQICGGDADCCTGLSCTAHVCDVPPG